MAAVLRGEKTDETTTHIKIPPGMRADLKALAAVQGVSSNELILAILDEALYGSRVVRLMREAREPK